MSAILTDHLGNQLTASDGAILTAPDSAPPPVAFPTYRIAIDWSDNNAYTETGEDVTARVLADRGVTMERGRDQLRALAPPMAGKLDFALDNRSRDYSTENAASPLAAQLRPGHRVRVTAASQGVTYPLATALLDDLPQEPALGARSVGVPCLGMLSRLAGKSVTTAVYQGITTDVAIHAILDAVGWPAAERAIQVGATILAWWWLDGADAFGALRTLLNTEGPGAALYERGDGYLVFENRHYRILTARSNTVQATIRDSGASPWHGGPFALAPNLKNVINRAELPVKLRTPQPLAQIWALGANLILAANTTTRLIVRDADGEPFVEAIVPQLGPDYTLLAGTATLSLDRPSGRAATLTLVAGASGATITALRLRARRLVATEVRVSNTVDTSASQAKYGLRTWAEETWPEIDLLMAQDLANAIVNLYQDPRAAATITVPGDDAAMLAQCLAREVSDRITVTEAQSGLNTEMTIERIAHAIGVRGRIVTTFGLEKAGALVPYSIFDSSNFDSAVFGF